MKMHLNMECDNMFKGENVNTVQERVSLLTSTPNNKQHNLVLPWQESSSFISRFNVLIKPQFSSQTAEHQESFQKLH